MKKLLSLLIASLMLMSCCFAAGGSDYLGTWLGDGMDLTFNDDNSVTVVSDGGETPSVWYEQNGEFFLLGAKMTLEGNTLTVAFASGDRQFKRDGEAPAPVSDPASIGIIGGADGPTSIIVTDDLSAYFGEWYYESYTLTIGEDGTAMMQPVGESMAYTVEDGVFMIDGLPCVINESGELVAGDEDYQMVFTREKPEISVPENAADYTGTWVYTLSLGDESFSMTLLLNGDGSGAIDTGDGEPAPLTWYEKDGQVYVDGTPAVLGEDGSLTLQDDAWPMTFFREGAEPAADPEPVSGGIELVGKTFVGTSATASGVSIDMSLMGRYSVTFYEDGKADMEIAGIMMPIQCTYEIGEGEVTVDYAGMKYIYTITDTGLTMNYFDTMLIDYEAE